jgi:hypothetical protein
MCKTSNFKIDESFGDQRIKFDVLKICLFHVSSLPLRKIKTEEPPEIMPPTSTLESIAKPLPTFTKKRIVWEFGGPGVGFDPI